MQAKELLEALVPAILEIDGGCNSCIREYVDHANKLMLQAGVPFRYYTNLCSPDYQGDYSWPIHIWVEGDEDAQANDGVEGSAS